MTRPVFLAALDPAWKSDSGGGGKGANAQYALESGRALAGQIRLSGLWPMGGDALCWVWATTLSMCSGEAHEFIARLGLRPCASFVWVKTDDVEVWGGSSAEITTAIASALRGLWGGGSTLTDLVKAVASALPRQVFKVLRRVPGIGQWQRCDHEFLILCRRDAGGGLPSVIQLPKNKSRSVIFASVGEHSEKPQEAWRLIEDVSRQALDGLEVSASIEFFCRAPRFGWGAWGTLDGPDGPVRFQAADGDWRL